MTPAERARDQINDIRAVPVEEWALAGVHAGEDAARIAEGSQP